MIKYLNIFLYPFIISVITAPIFYLLVDRITGTLFISIFLAVFGGSIYFIGLLIKLKSNFIFSSVTILISVLSYMLSVFIGVAYIDILLSIIAGNLLLATGMFVLDYILYGHRAYPVIIYLVASIVSIILTYLINKYSDRIESQLLFTLIYPVMIYCYLQASSISHYLFVQSVPR